MTKNQHSCDKCNQKCTGETKKELKRYCALNIDMQAPYKVSLKKDRFILKEE